MGDRYILSVTCPECGVVDEDVYYAPTCDFVTHKCSMCHLEIDLEEYTGISYEDASNVDVIQKLMQNMEMGQAGGKMSDTVTVIFPEGAFGPAGGYLLEAAVRAIAKAHGDESEWPEKYGTNVANTLFVMRRYCWCERDDCPWCADDAPNFWYKPLDYQLRWYKYIGRSQEANKELTDRQVAEMLLRCLGTDMKSVAQEPMAIMEIGPARNDPLSGLWHDEYGTILSSPIVEM